MSVLALIPARGGSKSIPRKNIRDVAGKPLIAYSIEQALAAESIDRVVVSTDDEEIAQVARDFGADVPFMRPAEFARDESTDIEVFRHAVDWFSTQESYEPGMLVHLRPTMPIRKVETIDRAVGALVAHPEADSLRSVHIALQTPFKMWFVDDSGHLDPVTRLEGVDEAYNLPRQKLPTAYWQDGYVDVVRRNVIVEQHSMNGRTILGFVVREACVDIDYEPSLREAERMLTGAIADADLPDPGAHPS